MSNYKNSSECNHCLFLVSMITLHCNMLPIIALHKHGMHQRRNQIRSSGSTGSCFVQVISVRPALKIIQVTQIGSCATQNKGNTVYGGATMPTYVLQEPCQLL